MPSSLSVSKLVGKSYCSGSEYQLIGLSAGYSSVFAEMYPIGEGKVFYDDLRLEQQESFALDAKLTFGSL